MNKLITRQPKRLFAFGCSFTKYYWGGKWAEIVAKDLDIKLYNYGQSGAGNQFIANTVAQADSFYKFNSDDLVIISWTNVCREDKWANRSWVTPGNIYTQGEYDQYYVKKWADPVGYLIRDLASIKLVEALLKNSKCQYHFISMCDLTTQLNQNDVMATYNRADQDIYERVCELYKPQLNNIEKGYFTTLWNGNVYANKIVPDVNVFGNHFSDGHPTPNEHLKYLQTTFEHTFKDSTIEDVNVSTENLIDFVKQWSDKQQKTFALYELPGSELLRLNELTSIKKSEPIQIF
jgi:hypothetical protein